MAVPAPILPWATTAPRRAASWSEMERQFAIPAGYGADQLVLMVKDPWWLYAYWEVVPATERRVRSQLAPEEIAGLQTILRVFDVTDRRFPEEPAHGSVDTALSGLAKSWYLQTGAPDREFVVELGLLTSRGRFLPLARSNRVRTPRASPSDVVDEAWAVSDEAFAALLALSAGDATSSLARRSGSGSWNALNLLGAQQAPAGRFWCRVDTDLVIHGVTDPKAKVAIQGQPVAVRRDGTFSVRFAMADGTQTVTIDVTSPDGRQTRTVSPVIARSGLQPSASASARVVE